MCLGGSRGVVGASRHILLLGVGLHWSCDRRRSGTAACCVPPREGRALICMDYNTGGIMLKKRMDWL